MQVKTTVRYHYLPVRVAKIKKTVIPSAGKMHRNRIAYAFTLGM
jgi:hypothetical protein